MSYREKMVGHWVAKVVKGIVLFVLFMGVFGFAFMYLWNALLPQLFGLPVISYWQGIGLIIISRALFGSWGGGGKHGGGHHRQHWKHNMRRKWAGMSEEERNEFREQWKNQCRPGWKNKDENNIDLESNQP
ncbi:MAG: hypothetical protein H6608_11970 [Flavobacteriales bacterium]|nr:hypothetical protein [Bacteroidota bacterium]MCB9241846.1 hypothetical protein [Flavobacteriales bacterium]